MNKKKFINTLVWVGLLAGSAGCSVGTKGSGGSATLGALMAFIILAYGVLKTAKTKLAVVQAGVEVVSYKL